MIHGPEHLSDVAAYTPGASAEEIRRTYGLDNVEKLASNENPFGPSPLAVAAANQALRQAHRYADGGHHLREVLAAHHGCGMDSITVNNGSDALIHQIMRTMLLPGDVALSTRGTFVSFGIAVATAHREAQYVDLGGGFRYNVEALAAAVTPSTKLIYIANPNNPTGTFITAHELSWLLERIPDTVLVVLDEAYHEYATAMAGAEYPDGVSLRHPNVLALRTFSKAHGLAALRIGYAVGSPDVIRWLLKTKLPFDPNGIGCAAAIAALDDVDHVRRTVETAVEGMAIVSKALNAAGYATSNSVANFVFVDCATHAHAREFHLALLHKGFISRPLAAFGIPTGVRITLGTPAQNAALAIALTELTELILQT